MKNWSYTITEGEHAGHTLWSGRYTAVCGIIVYRNRDGELMFLVNRRGTGTPDYQNHWNLPCGFLEADETGQQGCAREIFEECGIRVKNPDDLILCQVETDPAKCNNANVTLRYMLYITDPDTYDRLIDDSEYFNGDDTVHLLNNRGGEPDEVADVKWVNENDVDDFEWAFNHHEVLHELINMLNSNKSWNI